jgi:uncharacterized protein (DUF302 family)
MIKKITLWISTVLIVTIFGGCTMMKMGTAYMGFPSEAQDAYADMMANLSKTGDPAQAMMKEWKVADDVSEEEVFEAMKEYADQYNMRYVGEKDMFRIKDGKPDEVVHAKIGEFCSLSIAKKMLNHSRFYGGFMPCRVIFVEYGNGDRYLVSMDMTLAIYGGTNKKPIDSDLLDDMIAVKKAMEEIPQMAASGE